MHQPIEGAVVAVGPVHRGALEARPGERHVVEGRGAELPPPVDPDEEDPDEQERRPRKEVQRELHGAVLLEPAATEGSSWRELAVARSYFTEEVKDYLLNDSTILGATYQERYNKLFRGGLRIYTTFDQGIQDADDLARDTKL